MVEVTFGDEMWPLSTLLVLFEGSPMLSTLVLSEFFLHDPDDDVDNHIVTNSSLQSLTINACPDDAATLLDKLELPVLEVLTLFSYDDVDGSPSSGGGIISRSQFPAIKLFRLRCNFESGRLYNLLKRMDNLRTLICTRPDEIQVLSEVWYDANSLRHIICPCLEELSVEYRRTVPAYSLESIDDFMRARREVSGSLRQVTIPSFQHMSRGRRVEVQVSLDSPLERLCHTHPWSLVSFSSKNSFKMNQSVNLLLSSGDTWCIFTIHGDCHARSTLAPQVRHDPFTIDPSSRGE